MDIGVERIVEFTEEKYMEELNKEYFGFTNSTIITILTHLRVIWCKVPKKQNTQENKAFLQPQTPPAHIITFGCYLEKHHKLCKAIGIPISDTDKILLFVVQMYESKHFTEEEMMKYSMIPNDDKKYWIKKLT